MDLLTFIVKIYETSVWPMTVIIIVNFFGGPLRRIIELKAINNMHKTIKQGLDDGRSIPSREN